MARMINGRPTIVGLRKNGEEFPAEAAIARLDGEGETLFAVIRRDVTERIAGVVCTLDLSKRDTELKLLLGCTSREVSEILSFLNKGDMAAILVATNDMVSE